MKYADSLKTLYCKAFKYNTPILRKIQNKSFKIPAFTLAELLVTTLIVAIILVLFAPVITRRVSENVKVSQIKNSTKLFIYDENNPDCKKVSGKNSIDCSFSVPAGVQSLNAVIVSGGGGGAGATYPTFEYSKSASSKDVSSRTKEVTIVNGMKNVMVKNLFGAGGGGGGGAWAKTSGAPQSQADCDPYQAKFLTAGQNGKPVCVTKFNIGDIPGATNGGIAASIPVVSTKQSCSQGACCWKGQTASGCDSSGTTYSGCNRTVCNWHAANYSCNTLAYSGTKAGDWRLPTLDELSKWTSSISSISRNQGDNGLRLCDFYSGYGSARCNNYSAACPGSRDTDCHPYGIWTSKFSGNYFHNGGLNSGAFYTAYGLSNDAFSARCVYDGKSDVYDSLSGGGGSSASYIKNYQIPDSVISSAIGGKIILTASAGAAGGASATSAGASAKNGSNGGESSIEVKDKTGKTIWGLKAYGGYGGKGATGSSGGAGGAQRNACKIYQNGSWQDFSCTGAGIAGNSGNKVSSANSTNVAIGGAGGGSLYNSATASGGGNGADANNRNGYAGSINGAGGGGATVGFNSSNSALKGTGGKGADGVAEISYDLMLKAAGGGGGGGGAFALIKDIPVAPAKTYTVRVGKGGTGGAIAQKGEDAGESSINFDNMIYTLYGGKGGSVGTSQTASTDVKQGTGGARGTVNTNVSDKSKLTYEHGKDGTNAGDITINASNPYGGSYGGNGGDSGIKTKGGCGGLFIDSAICSNTNVNGQYIYFTAPMLNNGVEYGSSGAGGGGGGWSEDITRNPTPGAAGPGQDGYVFLYWVEY